MASAARVVIGFAGRAGSGKTTAQNAAAKAIGDAADVARWRVAKVNFADSLKKLAVDHFFWDGRKNESGRQLLQGIGQLGRDYRPDIWLEKLKRKVAIMPDLVAVLIGDVRYLNEVEWIIDQGGIVVLMEGRGGLEGEQGGHSSERLDWVDEVKQKKRLIRVQNTMSLKKLEARIGRLAESFYRNRMEAAR